MISFSVIIAFIVYFVIPSDAHVNYERYSRQILVHGAAAQLALQQSSIAVVGSGKLVRETAKHFVLAGVGGVKLVDGFRDTSHHTEYLRSLSSSTTVASLPSLPLANCVVCVNLAPSTLQDIVTKCDTNGVECIACGTSNGGGYVYVPSATDESKWCNSFISGAHDSMDQLCLSAPIIGAFAAQRAMATCTASPDASSFHYSMNAKTVKRESLTGMRILVVGAGAIGCEVLNNLAAALPRDEKMSGLITVADPDAIELSNLHRQLLFRDEDIGQRKAIVAARRVREMNPSINIAALSRRIDENMSYDDKFWRSFDDNVETRFLLNQQCIRYEIPMIDAGTSGYMGHTQVILPHLTEHYATIGDTGEHDPTIPVCSVKAFPRHRHHCIAWARSVFNDVFDIPENVTYADDAEDGQLRALRTAIGLYNKYFYNDIVRLLEMYPANATDDGGVSMWSHNMTVPRPKAYNKFDTSCREFVLNTAKLLCRAAGMNVTRAALKSKLRDVDFSNSSDYCINERFLRHQLPTPFDKDNWSHVQFIRNAANLRCEIYGLPTVTLLEAHQVAGAVMPALSTTTAATSGLVMVELLKLAELKAQTSRRPFGNFLVQVSRQRRRRRNFRALFRNSFLNVNTSALIQASPADTSFFSVKSRTWLGVPVKQFLSDWDRIEYDGMATMAKLCAFLKWRYDANVLSVSLNVNGPVLYSPLLSEFSKVSSSRILDIVEEGKLQAASFADLYVDAENDNHDPVNLPIIRVRLS